MSQAPSGADTGRAGSPFEGLIDPVLLAIDAAAAAAAANTTTSTTQPEPEPEPEQEPEPESESEPEVESESEPEVESESEPEVESEPEQEPRRKDLRHGCRRCPGVHFQTKKKTSERAKGNTLQYHIEQNHRDVTDWNTLAFEWGYRVHYADGTVEDKPSSGSSASVRRPRGARAVKGARVTKKSKK